MTDFVTAEAGIRQLHARCADAVWRKDYEGFGDCFTEDAEWRISGMVLRGRDEIVGNLKRLLPKFHRVLMTFRTPIIEVGEGTASGRTYTTEQSTFSDGRPATTIGIYYERFVNQGGQWRFSWRLFQLHYMGPADLSGPFFDNPDFGPPPSMPGFDAPTYNHSGLGVKKNE
jgi:uncharacterized protein (TIGR02246 family)